MRQQAGWTRVQLARRARVDAGYLGRIERGERTPSPAYTFHLVDVLVTYAIQAPQASS